MQGESAYEGTSSHSSYLPAPSAVGVDVGDGRIEINRDPAMTAPSPVRLPTTSPRPSPLLLEQLNRPHVNTDAHTFSYPIPAPPPPLPSASPRPSSKTPSAQPPVTTILPPPPSGAGLGAPAAYAALFDHLAAGDLADAHAHGQVALAVDGGSLGLRRGERLLNRIQLRRTIKQVTIQAGKAATKVAAACSPVLRVTVAVLMRQRVTGPGDLLLPDVRTVPAVLSSLKAELSRVNRGNHKQVRPIANGLMA